MFEYLQARRVSRLSCALLCLALCYIQNTPAAIYRWQDASGSTHYGDSPPAVTYHLNQLHPTAYDSYGVVANVIDGDTLVLRDSRRIRLLGINTPEIAHRRQPGEPLGEQAKHYLDTLVRDKRVRLRYDLQHHDHYHRLLAHLYLEDGEDINALLLQKGFARAFFLWPNMASAAHYYALEKSARKHRRGIWGLPNYQVKTTDELVTQRNRFTRIRDQVIRVEQRGRYDYLVFSHELHVAIKLERLPLFEKAGVDIPALAGHHLTLRGWLGQRHGAPYMKLDNPFQLEQIE